MRTYLGLGSSSVGCFLLKKPSTLRTDKKMNTEKIVPQIPLLTDHETGQTRSYSLHLAHRPKSHECAQATCPYSRSGSPPTVRGGQSHIPVLQHLFRTPDPHIQDLPRRFIRHHRDVFVPLAKRGLIHTDMRNNLRFPVLKSTLYRTVHDTENFLNL